MANTKKLNYKVSKNKHTTDEEKNNQIYAKIKIHNDHLKNINKIEKYKNLNMTEHKRDMNITKTDKCKKNWAALLPRNTELTWTLLKN